MYFYYLWFALLLVAFSVHSYDKNVGQLCHRYTLKNGRTKYRQRGRFVKFLCNAGYSLYGDAYSTCQLGVWDISSTPVCVKNSCKPFTKLPNNMLVYPEKNGAILNFICYKGFTLNGVNKTYCDGRQWQNNMPTCIASDTKPPLSCDFERDDICGWSHDLNHDFDWRRMNYFTPSGLIGTGPNYDHTKGIGKGGYYMYIESSSRNENDTARLISPVYDKSTSDICFEFYYHMYGSTTGTLRVYLKKVNESYDLSQSTVIFEKSGNQGNHWYKYLKNLGTPNVEYQIIIEGIRGKSYVSDIAIDDVRIIENCVLEEDSTTTTTDSTDTTALITLQNCENRCGMNSSIVDTINVISCDCDDECFSRNQCCPDYVETCLSDTTTELFTTDAVAMTTTKPTTRKMTTAVKLTTSKKTTTAVKVTTTRKTTTTTTRKPTTITTWKPKTTKAIKKPTTRKTTTKATTIFKHVKEYDYNTVPPKNIDYFEDNYIDNDYKLPSNIHFIKEVEMKAEKVSINPISYIIFTIIAILILTVIVITTIVIKKCYIRRRMHNRSSDSQSDVRFLTSDEVLDFTLSRDYDDL